MPGGHDYTIEWHPHDRRRCRAVCTCGWVSGWFSSAGLAGSAWDDHVASDGG